MPVMRVKELYTCSMCGITSETHKNWGPVCKLTGERVCDICCFECEHHFKWSGLWRCRYITEEEKRAERLKRARERFESENQKISAAYYERRREERREWAIKQARARARAEKRKQG